MAFFSYAQNFEDVILWRALKHIENGFYLDIGAFHPEHDSVSLAMYQHGWRGVHVEPVPEAAALFRESRPDELVVQCALSTGTEPLRLFRFEDGGMTTGDAQIAGLHGGAGMRHEEVIVPCRTLASLFAEIGPREIHWMKVDVEGMEADVLASWADHAARPWIVVVEATLPGSQQSMHEAWEALLTARGYSFVYFDGLNRFYVHETHASLQESFGPGPNVHDGFELARTSPFCAEINALLTAAENRLQDVEAQLADRRRDVSDVIGIVGHTLRLEIVNRVEALQAEIHALHQQAALQGQELAAGHAAAQAGLAQDIAALRALPQNSLDRLLRLFGGTPPRG